MASNGVDAPDGGEMGAGSGRAIDYRQIFLHANDAIMISDPESGLIVEANLKLCGLLRRTPEEVLGRHHDTVFCKPLDIDYIPDRSSGICRVAQCSENLLRDDGQGVPVEVSASLSVPAAGERSLLTCIVRDMTERKQAKARLAASNALLNAIGTLQTRFIGSVPMHTLLKEILDNFLSLSGSEYGFLGELLQTPDRMPYFKVQVMSDSIWRTVTREFYARNAPIGLEFYNLDGLFGATLYSATPLVFNDFSESGAGYSLPEGHPPIHAFAGLPVTHNGETLGFIGLANRPQGYDNALLDFLKPLLAICGNLIGANRASLWRQGAESELRRQALVFNNISDAVILTDHEGIVLDCNPSAVSMLGVPKKKLLGVPLDFALSPDDDSAQPVKAAIAAVDRAGCWSGMLAVRRRDGDQGVWDTNLLPLHDDVEGSSALVWFNHDITERRAAQVQLAERTLELNAIADLSPDGFVFVDRNNRITYVNPAFEQMVGLRASLLLGISRQGFDEAMSELCEAIPAAVPELADESTLLQLVRSKPIILKRTQRILCDDGGGLWGTVQYYRDISQETEVDRMKSDFLSTAAHELRTPMASVLGFSQLLLQREFDAEKRRGFLEIIHRQSGQLVSLINELLDLARIEARAGKDFKIGEHDLAPIIRECIAELYLPDGGQAVNAALPDISPRVVVDPDKLQLALGNVLGNAVKYSMGRGAIHIAISQRELNGARQVGIVVRDQGIGMSAEEIERVFERFYRADASGKIPGTGLGMSIVKEIVGIFKGAVDIASNVGEGTSVTLWLPAAHCIPGEARSDDR